MVFDWTRPAQVQRDLMKIDRMVRKIFWEEFQRLPLRELTTHEPARCRPAPMTSRRTARRRQSARHPARQRIPDHLLAQMAAAMDEQDLTIADLAMLWEMDAELIGRELARYAEQQRRRDQRHSA